MTKMIKRLTRNTLALIAFGGFASLNAYADGCTQAFWREVDAECGYDRSQCDTLDRRETSNSVVFESHEAEMVYKITLNPDGTATCTANEMLDGRG